MNLDPVTQLSMRLVSMAAQGQRPPCGDPETKHLWTSDQPEERALAQRRCAGCPVLDACLSEALHTRATAGVWGGQDFVSMTKHARHKLTARTASSTDDTDPLF